MLDNIFGILDKFGFGTQKRAISAQFSNAQLNSQIMLQRIDGFHGINEGMSAELICLSTNPFIELKQFIGCQIAVEFICPRLGIDKNHGQIRLHELSHLQNLGILVPSLG